MSNFFDAHFPSYLTIMLPRFVDRDMMMRTFGMGIGHKHQFIWNHVGILLGGDVMDIDLDGPAIHDEDDEEVKDKEDSENQDTGIERKDGEEEDEDEEETEDEKEDEDEEKDEEEDQDEDEDEDEDQYESDIGYDNF